MTPQQKGNSELVTALVENTGGLLCDIDSAMVSFMNKERKKKKPFPWKVDLKIGPEIKVNLTGYIKCRREAPKGWKNCLTSDPESNEVKPDVTFVRNNEDQEVIEKDELIESFKYGSQLISVTGNHVNHVLLIPMFVQFFQKSIMITC